MTSTKKRLRIQRPEQLYIRIPSRCHHTKDTVPPSVRNRESSSDAEQLVQPDASCASSVARFAIHQYWFFEKANAHHLLWSVLEQAGKAGRLHRRSSAPV